MENKVIITAASNKFFPSLINLLGSIRQNYPNAPKIYVYDLGLFWTYRKELEQIGNLEVVDMPHFCPFWRSCYTWKTYILSHPLGELNFYLDAGCQVLRPLDEIFKTIKDNGYFAVGQDVKLSVITPEEYKNFFPIEEKFYHEQCITAGIFGFKKDSPILKTLSSLYRAGKSGLALGFSQVDQWRNRGSDKNKFVRNCKIFRHDTTLLSILMRKDFGNFMIHDSRKYGNAYSDSEVEGQFIWNLRLNFIKLKYLKIGFLHEKISPLYLFNRLVVKVFLFSRIIRLFLKGKLWNIINLKRSAQ